MNNVKIIKKANKMSLIDFQSNLDYWKENNKNELVYKGGVRVSITEMAGQKKYLQSNIPKAKIKVWMGQILNGQVSKQWTKQGEAFSVENFGQRTNDGNLYSVKTQLEFKMYNGKPQFTFSITQGPGKKTTTGAVTMITSDCSKITTARKMLGMEEMNEIAVELLSFIDAAEKKAIADGKPYNDLMPIQEGKIEVGTSSHDKGSEEELQKLRQELILIQKRNDSLEEAKKRDKEEIQRLNEELKTAKEKQLDYTKMTRKEFGNTIYRPVINEANRRKELKESN